MSEIKKTAYVFPGQGAQTVGMGKDLYDAFDSVKTLFRQADEAVGFPLAKLCFEGPEEELKKTSNAQPALVAVSIACLRAAQEVAGKNRHLWPDTASGNIPLWQPWAQSISPRQFTCPGSAGG